MKKLLSAVSLMLVLLLFALMALGSGSSNSSTTVSSSDTVSTNKNTSDSANSSTPADAEATTEPSTAEPSTSESVTDTSATAQAAPSNTNTVTDNRTQAATVIATAEFSGDDFEHTGHLYENSVGDSLYFVIVKNNSEAVVSVDGNATAKDSSGNAIGADTMSSIDVLGPGETSIGYFYFDNISDIDTVDYELTYSRETYYKSVIGNLEINQVLNERNVTVTVTNKGDINAQFVEAYALFFDANENVISYTSTYITDNDSEIKPGATLSAQLDIYGQAYDHVEVYFTGRSDGSSSEVTSLVSDSDFSVTQHKYENSIGDTLWFLVITNNSEYDVEVSANSTAYDSAGNVLGADDASIDILGAGQTSICDFYYDNVQSIDHIDYQLFFDTNSYYDDVLHNLSAQTTINDSNVIVEVTNNGSYPAEFVEAYALFFDANMNVVGFDSTYITDGDYEIKSGATISGQLSIYQAFSTVEVYFVGRHSQW